MICENLRLILVFPSCSFVSFVVKGFASHCSTQSPPAATLPSYAGSTQSDGICLACAHASENFGFRIQIQSLSAATGPAPSPAPPRNPDTPAVSSAPQSQASAPPPQTETLRPARWSGPASGEHPPSEGHRPAGPSSALAAKSALKVSSNTRPRPVCLQGVSPQLPVHPSRYLPNHSRGQTLPCPPAAASSLRQSAGSVVSRCTAHGARTLPASVPCPAAVSPGSSLQKSPPD